MFLIMEIQYHHINKNLLTLLLTVFLDFLGFGLIIPIIAPILLDPVNGVLHAGYSYSARTIILGLLIAAFPIAQFFGAPILGSLSDKYGRKKILLVSIFMTSISLFLFGIGVTTQNLFLLFFSRFLNGLMGGNVSTAQSAIADMSDLQSKAKNFGLMGMMFGLGFILGPFFGGKLADSSVLPWFNFSTPFWVAGSLSMINVFLISAWFQETLKISKDNVRLNFGTGIQNFRRAFSSLSLRTIFTVSFLTIFGFNAFMQFFQVYLITRFQYNQAHIGMIYAYMGFWIVIAQGGFVRLLSNKFLPWKILRVSILVLSVAIMMLLLPATSSALFWILPFVALAQGVTTPNIIAMISNSAGVQDQGEILGINQSVQAVGFAVPPVLAGCISTLDYRLPVIMGSLFVAAAWLIHLMYFHKSHNA
jgi:MFS transporter, DHA1 family, tetracycline resistance protein